MNSISVCKGCGRTINLDYSYCPWCGQAKVLYKDDSIDELFIKFSNKQKDIRRKQIATIKNQLDNMEKELAMYVLSSEMHK